MHSTSAVGLFPVGRTSSEQLQFQNSLGSLFGLALCWGRVRQARVIGAQRACISSFCHCVICTKEKDNEASQQSVDYLRDDLGMGTFTESAGNGGKPKGLRFEVSDVGTMRSTPGHKSSVDQMFSLNTLAQVYKGMAHSACPEEIEHVGQFLEKVVPA